MTWQKPVYWSSNNRKGPFSPVMVKVNLLWLCDIISLLFRYNVVGIEINGGGPGIQWVFLPIIHAKNKQTMIYFNSVCIVTIMTRL
jgi:hypothetical protein